MPHGGMSCFLLVVTRRHSFRHALRTQRTLQGENQLRLPFRMSTHLILLRDEQNLAPTYEKLADAFSGQKVATTCVLVFVFSKPTFP